MLQPSLDRIWSAFDNLIATEPDPLVVDCVKNLGISIDDVTPFEVAQKCHAIGEPIEDEHPAGTVWLYIGLVAAWEAGEAPWIDKAPENIRNAQKSLDSFWVHKPGELDLLKDKALRCMFGEGRAANDETRH